MVIVAYPDVGEFVLAAQVYFLSIEEQLNVKQLRGFLLAVVQDVDVNGLCRFVLIRRQRDCFAERLEVMPVGGGGVTDNFCLYDQGERILVLAGEPERDRCGAVGFQHVVVFHLQPRPEGVVGVIV